MPVIEFETTLTEINSIEIPESASKLLHKNEHVRVFVVPESEMDKAEEKQFLSSSLQSFFDGYEDNDDYYEKKYGTNATT